MIIVKHICYICTFFSLKVKLKRKDLLILYHWGCNIKIYILPSGIRSCARSKSSSSHQNYLVCWNVVIKLHLVQLFSCKCNISLNWILSYLFCHMYHIIWIYLHMSPRKCAYKCAVMLQKIGLIDHNFFSMFDLYWWEESYWIRSFEIWVTSSHIGWVWLIQTWLIQSST